MAMLKTVLRVSLSALAAVMVAAPAFAGMLCGEREGMAKQLEKKYQEVPHAVGLSSQGGVIEVFASASGSWTILITYPNGMTCAIATGEAWERLPIPIKGPEA